MFSKKASLIKIFLLVSCVEKLKFIKVAGWHTSFKFPEQSAHHKLSFVGIFTGKTRVTGYFSIQPATFINHPHTISSNKNTGIQNS